VFAFATVTVAAGCGSSNNDNGSTNGGTLTAASFNVQTDPAIAGQVAFRGVASAGAPTRELEPSRQGRQAG
jgi:hypothetical protein